jgi:hypothetical protein
MRGILWRGGRAGNAAGFKKEKKSVSPVILASEVRILPSPYRRSRRRLSKIVLFTPLTARGGRYNRAH